MTKKDKRKIVQMILHQNLEKDEKEDSEIARISR